LNHPAVAIPLATGITGVSAYLAQDYVAAESLDLAVREYGAAPPADALRVAVHLAGALDLAAVANVNHGALHPRDVLLSDDETRLTGIGVARALESVGVATPVRRPYTAPERRASGPWSRQADVFSLAALVHELLWGRRLTAEGSEVAESLSELPNARMKPLRAAFTRALAERPEDRFDSALEFAEALKDAFPDIQLAEPPPPKKKQPRKKSAASMLPLEGKDPAASSQTTEPQMVEAPDEKPSVVSSTFTASFEIAASEPVADPNLPERPEPVEPTEPLAPFEPPSRLASFESPEAFQALESLEPREPAEPRERAEPREPIVPIYSSAVMEQTRSAVWPLMAALVIGLAIGFAGGYGIGTTREHVTQVATEAQAAPVTAGRDATEIAVARPPDSSAKRPDAAASNIPPAKSATRPDAPAPPSDRRAASAPEHRIAARTAPERSTTRPRPAAPVPAGTSGEFVGRLNVDSRPVGARVFLDNKPIGVTPLALPSIRAGEHAIRLERDGYRHWTSTVRIVAGEQNKVTASLDK
jgi:hypothetical protein